jgi:hypothetical protein
MEQNVMIMLVHFLQVYEVDCKPGVIVSNHPVYLFRQAFLSFRQQLILGKRSATPLL